TQSWKKSCNRCCTTITTSPRRNCNEPENFDERRQKIPVGMLPCRRELRVQHYVRDRTDLLPREPIVWGQPTEWPGSAEFRPSSEQVYRPRCRLCASGHIAKNTSGTIQRNAGAQHP